jgi:hypothetical protein
MATRGLISSLVVGIWIAFLLADCSSFPRKSFTREQQVWPAFPASPMREFGRMIQPAYRVLPFGDRWRKPASIDVLALSGGGAEGAFGAGLLVGWTEAGNRPEFAMVSGTSSGALIAPFAFLGASHDPILRDLFTSGIAETVLRVDGLPSAAQSQNQLLFTGVRNRKGWRQRGNLFIGQCAIAAAKLLGLNRCGQSRCGNCPKPSAARLPLPTQDRGKCRLGLRAAGHRAATSPSSWCSKAST